MSELNLSYRWSRLNMAEKLIAVNTVIFIAVGLVEVFGQLDVKGLFLLPGDLLAFGKQPWSLITYSFLHGGVWHILFNMLWLHFAGRIILNLFDSYRFLSVYFLGVILGGLSYLAIYNVFPAVPGNGLLGSSAGVMAVLIFICSYIPNQEIRVIFFNVKLWQIGVFFVIFDLLNIASGGNVGGRMAHLGGAAVGFLYGRQLLNGRDIAAGFTRFIEQLFQSFQGGGKKTRLKTVYKKKTRKGSGSSQGQPTTDEVQKRIDEILDKISKSGYDSLTQEEKDFLFKAGKEE